MLREIQNISFPQLKEISLYQNFIESIEGLDRIWMPVLDSLLIGTIGNIKETIV